MQSFEALEKITAALSVYGIEDAGKEAEFILTDGAGIDRVSLYRDNPLLSGSQEEEIKRILSRRAKREPLQYILGYADFYGLKIKVGPGVLIPRPETELLAEEAVKAVNCETLNMKRKTKNSELFVLDLCTGSGCLALALAGNFTDISVYGTDISDMALEYAIKNAEFNNIKNVTFLKGDLYEPVSGLKFDIIVSNPPYIKRNDIFYLQPEIEKWEPSEALDGGTDGLYFYRELLGLANGYLNSGGRLIVEAGDGEAADIINIAGAAGLECIAVIRDYAGIERVLHFVSDNALLS